MSFHLVSAINFWDIPLTVVKRVFALCCQTEFLFIHLVFLELEKFKIMELRHFIKTKCFLLRSCTHQWL